MQIRKAKLHKVAAFLLLIASASPFDAAPALSVVGKDYIFPNKVDGLLARLSDFRDLQINSFVTSDRVKLTY